MGLREHKSRPKFSFMSSLKDRNTDPRNCNVYIAAPEETDNFAEGCGGERGSGGLFGGSMIYM